jgi:UDP-N-acetylmuramate dehydrogenase
MQITENISLADHSTMRLGGVARYFCEVTSRMDVLEALSWAQTHDVPVIMIGDGSNVVWRDEGFPGLVIMNRIIRFELFQEDELNAYVTIGAGENWDAVVARTVEAGLSGIESLSLVPGTAGATPIQNVGAYGQEISQTLVTIEAFDTEAKDFVTVPAADCGFGYRTSRFKAEKGRWYITAITLHLLKSNPEPPFYPDVANYLRDHSVELVTPLDLRTAVLAIRQAKLPDPATVANNGSFFANPVVSEGQLAQIEADVDAEVPHWPAHDGLVKLSAAWLIEQAGFKDFHDTATGMATWPTQPLVLVNERAHRTADLLAFKQTIVDAVDTKFAVTLTQEPELLP